MTGAVQVDGGLGDGLIADRPFGRGHGVDVRGFLRCQSDPCGKSAVAPTLNDLLDRLQNRRAIGGSPATDRRLEMRSQLDLAERLVIYRVFRSQRSLLRGGLLADLRASTAGRNYDEAVLAILGRRPEHIRFMKRNLGSWEPDLSTTPRGLPAEDFAFIPTETQRRDLQDLNLNRPDDSKKLGEKKNPIDISDDELYAPFEQFYLDRVDAEVACRAYALPPIDIERAITVLGIAPVLRRPDLPPTVRQVFELEFEQALRSVVTARSHLVGRDVDVLFDVQIHQRMMKPRPCWSPDSTSLIGFLGAMEEVFPVLVDNDAALSWIDAVLHNYLPQQVEVRRREKGKATCGDWWPSGKVPDLQKALALRKNAMLAAKLQPISDAPLFEDGLDGDAFRTMRRLGSPRGYSDAKALTIGEIIRGLEDALSLVKTEPFVFDW